MCTGVQEFNKKHSEAISEQDPEVNIWAHEGQNAKWRRIHNEELHSCMKHITLPV